MPFATTTTQLINRSVNVAPEFGFGWVLIEAGSAPVNLPVPGGFQGTIAKVLFDSESACALIARISVQIQDYQCLWASFIPRTLDVIDLRQRSVGCNVLMADKEPRLQCGKHYPDRDLLISDSHTRVYGFATISVSDWPR